MKPHRIAVTHSLVLEYGLHKKMQVNEPKFSSNISWDWTSYKCEELRWSVYQAEGSVGVKFICVLYCQLDVRRQSFAN